jgi:hypothetical protein
MILVSAACESAVPLLRVASSKCQRHRRSTLSLQQPARQDFRSIDRVLSTFISELDNVVDCRLQSYSFEVFLPSCHKPPSS